VQDPASSTINDRLSLADIELGEYTITVIGAQNSAARETRESSGSFDDREMEIMKAERRPFRFRLARIVAAAGAGCILLMTSAVFAQGTGQGTGGAAGGVKATGGKDEGSYGYEFSDDPLAAGGFGPNDATIRVRTGPIRSTLIRPRTSFVPEMLKSVENL
jgi:hypothetical protein